MRAWFAKFIGEGANDDGGLFRESITGLCLELQSKVLDLFLPVGNQTNKIGENRDCWIVNPKATSKIHLRKFQFIGCLFGMCVRSGVLINLNLAPMFWKRLTGDTLTSRDIMAIDSSFMNNLEAYKNFKAEGKSEQEFISTF
jgi:E3 ubiquitin-protein ligase HERC2